MADQNPPKKQKLICFCHCVPEAEILEAIKNGADTIEKIQEQTLASTGCGGCYPDVCEILKEAKKRL